MSMVIDPLQWELLLKKIFVNKIKNKNDWFTSNEYKTLQSVLNIWYLSI